MTNTGLSYSESSQLLGEYAANGTAVAQYLWLGNIPIGVIQSGQVYAIHTDHLTTPRAVINPQGTTVWRWESLAQPFGESLADEGPDGNGVTFTMNLRFPGQYFDQETRLHYNYFRDYDPAIGRYVESDQVGLDGGLNTYNYAINNPIINSDPKGENVAAAGVLVGGGILIAGCAVIQSCKDAAKRLFDTLNNSFRNDFSDNCLDDDDEREDCQEHFTRCLDTPLQSLPGSNTSDSRCGVCRDQCVRNGGTWPDIAITGSGAVRCDYWNF